MTGLGLALCVAILVGIPILAAATVLYFERPFPTVAEPEPDYEVYHAEHLPTAIRAFHRGKAR